MHSVAPVTVNIFDSADSLVFIFFLIFFFVSWQTGTVALILLSMNALGYIELNIVPVNR